VKSRHWKQQWHADAHFDFRRKLRIGEGYVYPGDPVTPGIRAMLGRHRLRRWWDAGAIEIHGFSPSRRLGVPHLLPAPAPAPAPVVVTPPALVTMVPQAIGKGLADEAILNVLARNRDRVKQTIGSITPPVLVVKRKRKRGRPRKNPLAPVAVNPLAPVAVTPPVLVVKRKRGRPRKNPLPAPATP